MKLPLWAQAALFGVLLVSVAVLAWNFDPFGRRKRAEVRAANAEAQAQADQSTVKALDTYSTRTVIIREKADASVRAIQAAPGADTPVPPDVLAGWLRGLSDETDADDPGKP